MYSKQKSLNFGHYVPNDKVLNKKIPENPKYKHVKPAIDTGKNVRRHIDELKEKQKNCSHKKDEVFKRIKVSAFIKLALAVATDLLSNESDTVVNEPSVADMPVVEPSERRGIVNVLMGIGELDIVSDKRKIQSAPMKPMKTMPYLLLDVRDRDAFAQCHIITAKHYPSTMLSRSIGYEIEDMKLFKNRPYGLIILYDDDETTAIRVATTLVERGYENVYLLTGGLKLALEVCPYGLTTSSQMLTPVHMLTQGASSNMQKNIGKEYFSLEDVDTVQHYMDTYPNRGSNSIFSSKSSQSRKDKSLGSLHRSNLDSTSASSRASTISRRQSACSSLSTEQKQQLSTSSRNTRLTQTHLNCSKTAGQMHLKPVLDDRTKKPKKAPWK